MSTYHHAYPEGLLVVERENRESLLLIGARSRPQKTKTGAKRIHRKRGGEGGGRGGEKETAGVRDVRRRRGIEVFRLRS